MLSIRAGISHTFCTRSGHGNTKTDTTYSQAKHTTGTSIQDLRKILQQKNAASSHIGEHHQKSNNMRDKGHKQRKEKYMQLLIPNSIQFHLNYNI
jgi:hypothetical protein